MPDCDKLDCCGDEAYGYQIIGANPEPLVVPAFELIITIDPSGSGTTTGEGTWSQNTFVTITATPAEGFQFSNWSGDFESENATDQVYMDGDKSVVANFIPVSYYLTLLTNPEGSADVTGAGPYDFGDTAAIEATPVGFFEFLSWSGDIDSVNNPENVLMNGNKTITANLARPLYSLIITLNPPEGGSATGAGDYFAGQIVPVTALPNPTWTFSSWTGDESSIDNPLNVLMDGPKAIVANFNPIPCPFDLELAGGNPPDPFSVLIPVGEVPAGRFVRIYLTFFVEGGYAQIQFTSNTTGLLYDSGCLMTPDRVSTIIDVPIGMTSINISVIPNCGEPVAPYVLWDAAMQCQYVPIP